MRRKALLLLILALVPGAALAEEMKGVNLGGQEYDVVGQAVGNQDSILIHVGLGDPNNGASWGLAVSHAPQNAVAEQTTGFGAFAQLQTDLLQIGQVPQPYQGLDLKGFVGCDVLWDFENDKVQIWPSLGARIAPQKTMAFIAMVVYPMGDSDVPSALDLNEPTGLFGLELRF